MSEESRTKVKVEIGGREYAIRADATPDYTRRCANFVDRTVRDLTRQAGLVDPHRAVILAALSLADQLFKVRQEVEQLRGESAERAEELSRRIDEHLRRD